MKTALSFILCISLLPTLSTAQEETSQNSGYYQFYTSEVLVRFKGKAVPIKAAKKKGVFVSAGNRLKRLPWSTPARLQPQIGVSNRFVTVADYDYSYFYQGESRWEAEAYDSVRLRQRQTNMAITSLSTPGQSPSASQQAQIDDLIIEQQEYEQEMGKLVRDGELKADGYGDSVRMSLTLTPNMDIPRAYCAILTDYHRVDGERFVVTKTRWIGDLLKGIPEELNFTLKLREGDYSNSKSQFYLFSGDSKPVPTNFSNGLKELNVAELKELAGMAN